MPYSPSPTAPTPESLLSRSDSKDPLKTCKGITQSGQRCRNPIASPNAFSHHNGYCHRHRDQASTINDPTLHTNDTPTQPKRRTSTDTLAARFNGLDLKSDIGTTRPPRRPRPQARPHRRKPTSVWDGLCCISSAAAESDSDDYVEIVRHRRRTQHSTTRPQVALEQTAPPLTPLSPATLRPHSYGTPAPTHPTSSHLSPPPVAASRPRPHRIPASAPAATNASFPTHNFMRYIPRTTEPQTAAVLMTELAKPISISDEEGYIYIFWLTPESRAAWKPSDDDAESLLQPPRPSMAHARRTSAAQTEMLRANSVVRPPRPRGATSQTSTPGEDGSEKRTILLKIGRASNVHRRMSEWTRQCGYDLSLVRFYPYVPSSALKQASPSPSPGRVSHTASSPAVPSAGVRKVPYSHRVERLVHLELASMRKDQGKCEACGREHREWFEVQASKNGVKAVDEVVRRWVGWAEDVAKGGG